MELSEVVLTIIGAGVLGLITIFYYSTPQYSSCYFCSSTISHKKTDRYYIKVKGKNFAVCEKCNRNNSKETLLTPEFCSCCNVPLKYHTETFSWTTESKTYELCLSCNQKGQSIIDKDFQLSDVLTDDFILENTYCKTLNEYVSASKIKIESQDDLNKNGWNTHVSSTSLFSSWEEMEQKAIEQLMQRERKKVVIELKSIA